MAAASNYLENAVVDHIFRASTFSKPSALYVGLFTAAPNDAGGGTEVTGGSYARAQLDPSNSNWAATQGGTSGASTGTSGETSNAVEILFPAPSANWGQVGWVGIFDASTGGNLLFHGALTTPKTVNNGDPAPTFPVAALKVIMA